MKTLLVAITVTDEWEGTPWDLLDEVTCAEPSGEALANPRFVDLTPETLEDAALAIDGDIYIQYATAEEHDQAGSQLRIAAQALRGVG